MLGVNPRTADHNSSYSKLADATSQFERRDRMATISIFHDHLNPKETEVADEIRKQTAQQVSPCKSSTDIDDDNLLASMGYEPELKRGLGSFMNFSFGFTEVSVISCVSSPSCHTSPHLTPFCYAPID